jgi:hypothetical protein
MRRLLNHLARHKVRRSLAHWSFACACVLVAAAAAAPRAGHAQPGQSQALERRVKAAFLYKFLGYTEFPAAVTIVVAGSDEMLSELGAITAGRSVNNRPIAVRALRENEANGVAHLLFVAGSDCTRTRGAIRATRALLVVTECDNGLQQGSVINFRIVDDHVRFDVALDAAERNGVKLSSRLLTVANRVSKGST